MPEIQPEEARNVLHYFGHPQGWEAGSFTTRLLSTIAHADHINQARLALGFPSLVSAMQVAQYEVGGVDRLLQIAEGAR